MTNLPGWAFAVVSLLILLPVGDPYSALSQNERDLLKPYVERWVRDQTKHDWSDLWEIQDQTPELKNELLLGEKNAPDMNRSRFIQAMTATIGSGYPEIKEFRLTDVHRESEGFRIEGCGKLQRENWKQTSVTSVHGRVVDKKVVFGLPESTPDHCKL